MLVLFSLYYQMFTFWFNIFKIYLNKFKIIQTQTSIKSSTVKANNDFKFWYCSTIFYQKSSKFWQSFCFFHQKYQTQITNKVFICLFKQNHKYLKTSKHLKACQNPL